MLLSTFVYLFLSLDSSEFYCRERERERERDADDYDDHLACSGAHLVGGQFIAVFVIVSQMRWW